MKRYISWPILIFLIVWLINSSYNKFSSFPAQTLGVTFSPRYAKSLGLDPLTTFSAILTELKTKNIRLPVYWSDIEPSPGQFDFQAYDQLVDLAGSRDAKLVLAIGYKLPRWPECFAPSWTNNFSDGEFESSLLVQVKAVTEHFKSRKQITAWQIENEPLYNFGDCKKYSLNFLEKEISLVRSLDNRPIFLSESGELGSWVNGLRLADAMGISLYRYAWDPFLGFHTYPLPPLFYPAKLAIVKLLGHLPENHEVFISELQAEPWPAGSSIPNTPITEQVRLFSLKNFQDNLNFAKLTGFKAAYLWGVEWWYYLRQRGQPQYWDFAKVLF